MHRLATLALVAAVATACGSAREVKDPRGASQNAFGCDRCHGYPPQPGWLSESRAHPKGENCSFCHPRTVKSDNHTLLTAAENGQHLNGQIDYVRGHETGYEAPALHAPDALAGLAKDPSAQDCTVCHGADLKGGVGFSCVACHNAPHAGERFAQGVNDFRVNCTFCHGTPKVSFSYPDDLALAAPPDAIFPHDPEDGAIGAHQKHLHLESSTAAATATAACASCHTVPPGEFPGSLDHLSSPTVVVFSGLAVAGGATTSFDEAAATCTNYCHGATMKGGTNATPKWTDGAQGCSSCHGSPPPTGAGSAGWHQFHVNSRGLDCGKCHKGYVKDAKVVPELHVNGTADVRVDDGTADGFNGVPVYNRADHSWSDDQCAACHGHLNIPIP
jgi:predicted CxxxxCH...CXXCH cytochrome family protein